MSLYLKEEICQGCDYAAFHECCKSLCRCKENHIEGLDRCKGKCEYYTIEGTAANNAFDRKVEIERLAGIAFDKRRYYQNLGIMQSPTDPEEARKSAQAYAVAQAEMYDAEKALRDIQQAERDEEVMSRNRECTARVWVKPVARQGTVPHKNGYWKEIAGVFHQFGQNIEEFPNGGCSYTTAIIEDVDGQVYEAEVTSLKFTSKGEV